MISKFTCIALVFVLSTPVLRAEPEDAEAPGPAFFLGSVSDQVPEGTFDKIADFVGKNLAVQLEEVELKAEAGDIDHIAKQLVSQRPERAVAMIVLIDPEDASGAHSIFKYDDKIALINIPVISEGADADQAFLRTERLVMRALAFMTGFEECPDPFSVMAPYQTLTQLDARGRNYSPPDTFGFQKKMRELGVPLIEASPFFMAP